MGYDFGPRIGVDLSLTLVPTVRTSVPMFDTIGLNVMLPISVSHAF